MFPQRKSHAMTEVHSALSAKAKKLKVAPFGTNGAPAGQTQVVRERAVFARFRTLTDRSSTIGGLATLDCRFAAPLRRQNQYPN